MEVDSAGGALQRRDAGNGQCLQKGVESGEGRGSFEDRKELHIFMLMGMIYWQGGKPMLEKSFNKGEEL